MSKLAPLIVLATVLSIPAHAQNGLSDERVSLPDGPGSIGGIGENIDVNPNMGSASFNVAIRVPQGPNPVMTPRLSLAYASGQGTGLAGIGWELGVQSIERMVSKGLPTYTSDDHFAADGGEELVYVGTLEGDRVYRLRFEGAFVRYRWHGAGASGYWTAEFPDGRIGWFGADPSGVIVPSARVQGADGRTFRYLLVEMRDTVGRRMVYTYTKQDGWPVPDEIQYGFGGLATPRFSVRMGYEARPDVRSDATPGFEIQLARRLTTVQVLSETTPIRRYDLVYESAGASGGTTRLASITERGRDGGLHPIAHHFTYTRTLAGTCTFGCETPFMVDMGTLPGGVDIQTGLASLIDINGDSLPDILESDLAGHHRFHISRLSTEGRPTFTTQVVASQATTNGSSFILSNPGVQLLDVNGDGFTDIVDQVNGRALCNNGSGDWSGSACLDHPGDLPTLSDDPGDPASSSDPLGMRFFDYDNDKRIDLLRTPDNATAVVSRNTGTGYQTVTVEAIGSAFDAEELQLADMNGDGLQDPVRLIADGATTNLQYKLNLGFGRWSSSWTTIAIGGLASGDLDNAVLQDLDGDGLDDLVLVAGTTVSTWRNENAGRFASRKDLTSAGVEGEIPERTGAETVLFADMNGNGTDDVVWVASNGHVRFLELYPVRPNLLARIDNGIGWVRTMSYGTSIAQRARDAGTDRAWRYPLPQSMNVVTAIDSFVTLTGKDDGSGVHSREEMSYRDGYYDGGEKDFRGFERVEKHIVTDEDDGQDPALDVMLFDVGREDVYHRGLKIGDATFGGAALDQALREAYYTYGDCPVADVPETDPPVRNVCRLATETTHQEGAASSVWKTVRTEFDYDGYGNVTEQRELGVIGLGARDALTGCGACPSLPANQSAGPCGAECTGDERITTTRYVKPGVDTGGAWLVNLPSVVTVTGVEGGRASEQQTFYDGPDFEGLALGKATRGLVTRVLDRVSATETVPSRRYKWDAQGNMVALLSPNAEVSDPTRHRRDFTFDERGLRVTRVTVHAGDYDLVQDLSYESSYLFVSEKTEFRVRVGSEDLTPRNPTSYAYDEHGRLAAMVRPGDSREAPSMTFAYELADPVSRIYARSRRAVGGPLELESVTCQDGRGRVVQSMNKVAEGRWRVDGFRVFNAQGQMVRDYLPYQASSGACATTPPSDVGYRAYQRDGLTRVVSETAPDAAIYGTASVARTTYAPLAVTSWDYNDSDPQSAALDTPTTRTFDGLDRVVNVTRRPTKTTAETYTFAWDELGNLAGVTDAMGDTRLQEFDLNGRVVRTVDPNGGETRYTYLSSGLESRRTDARGVVLAREYDALDRLVRTFDASAREATLEETLYDRDASCADCRNAAGRVVGARYPLPDGSVGRDAMGYDARGNRTLMRRVLEGHTFDTTFTWDGDDKLVSTTYPDGRTLTMTRDLASRPTAIAGVITAVSYNEAGRRAGITHANGVTETFRYDALLRESGATASGSGGTFIDTGLAFDRDSNVLTVRDDVSAAGHPSHAATYVYDAYNRLTRATLGADAGETVDYAYDASDNLTSRVSSRGAASAEHVGAYTYGEGAGPNAVTKAGTTSYGYDTAGQATRRGSYELSWDHRGRLVEAVPSEGELTEVAYGPDNERAIKLEDGGVTYYGAPDFEVRDGIASVYATVDDRRVARLRSDTLASRLLPDANSDEVIDIADAWLGRASEGPTPTRLLRAAARRMLFEAQGDTVHLHEDVRGSIVAVTDADSKVVAERAFNPYGTERAATGWLDEHGFTGKEEDTNGLLHFNLRMLDPRTGRWLSPDPAFSVLSEANVERLNEAVAGYAYVGGNPVAAVDPEGDVLFALFTAAKRKVLPFRNKGGGVESASVTKTGAKKAAPLTGHLVKTLERRQAKLAALNERVAAFPQPSPGEAPALAAERKSLEKQADKLGKKTERLRRKVYPAQPNGIGWVLPDVLLVSTVVGAVLGGVAYATGVFDSGDTDEEPAQDPPSPSLVFGGK